MTLSEELAWRGFIKDKTFENADWLNTPRTFYLGADAQSADSLTIGNLAIYMLARQLAAHGWKAVMLVGGATSLIGDPGGKDDERELKTQEEIEKNIAGIAAQVQRIFGDYEFTPVNNYDWFKDMGYLEFLRDVGKHYSMTELVQRDFIASRMGEGGSGISYAEFSYSLIQGYDYYRLFKDHGVELQIGGSDQWGNMLSGAPLIRKKEGKEVHALSMPLVINKATGKKFGKSEEGAVWLDPAKTSPTQFHQFWMNVDDAGLESYLKIYTQLSREEIDRILEQHNRNPAERVGQKELADRVTALVHSEKDAQTARVVGNVLAGRTDIGSINPEILETMRQEVPSMRVSAGADLAEILVQTGLAVSKTEARRFLAENAISINNEKTQKEQLEESDFQNGRLLIRKGKAFKDSALVERS